VILLFALLIVQSTDPQTNRGYADAVLGYNACLEREALRLDDGKEASASVFEAAVESCKQERGLLIGYGALLKKERDKNASVDDGFRYGRLLAAEFDKQLKPKVVLRLLEDRAAKRK
jgi:hypothetical protein